MTFKAGDEVRVCIGPDENVSPSVRKLNGLEGIVAFNYGGIINVYFDDTIECKSCTFKPSMLKLVEAEDKKSNYYNANGVECLDVMVNIYGKEAVKNFCICNVFKYLWRWKNKNGEEDLRKAKNYLDKYFELADE